MHNSKLLTTLKSLSTQEMKQLGDFVQSPYHNKNDKVVLLYKYIHAAAPNWESKAFAKTTMATKMFGKSKNALSYLSRTSTALYQLVLQFLRLQNLQQYPSIQQSLLLRELQVRGLHKAFKQQLQQQNNNPNDDQFLYYEYVKSVYMHEYQIMHGDLTNTGLTNILEQLEVFYAASKLKLCALLLNQQDVVATTGEVWALNPLLEAVNNNLFDTQKYILIQGYYHAVLLLQQNTLAQFNTLKNWLVKKSTQIQSADKTALYTIAFNFCNKQFKSGKHNYLSPMFELYKNMLNENILINDGYIDRSHFKNMVTIACRLGAFEWAENFVNDHHKKLMPKDRKNLNYYCKGLIYFYQQQYKKAQGNLAKVHFDTFFDHLQTEMLTIKTYFALEEYQALEGRLHTFYNYLKRHKQLSESSKLAYLNFIRVAKRLMTIYEKISYLRYHRKAYNNAKRSYHKLQTDLQNLDTIVDKNWLSKKVNYLTETVFKDN